MWSKTWIWLSRDEGWKALTAVVYLLICIFDFVVVPMWFGLSRVGIDPMKMLTLESISKLAPAVQLEIIKSLSYQHEPFTLKGGGLFHLAFGALLTGSAIAGRKTKE